LPGFYFAKPVSSRIAQTDRNAEQRNGALSLSEIEVVARIKGG
jgi:hypothetical protein